MSDSTFDRLFDTITELVLCHSPSGAESEIDQWLLQKFQALEVLAALDAAGNLVAKIPGHNLRPFDRNYRSQR